MDEIESPPRGGVDRNGNWCCRERWGPCRPLAGAWIETPSTRPTDRAVRVAPSRWRGSKHHHLRRPVRRYPRRPLAGAWIETRIARGSRGRRGSPPRGGVDRNLYCIIAMASTTMSPPRGGVDRNRITTFRSLTFTPSPPRGGVDRNCGMIYSCHMSNVAPSRGRGSKPAGAAALAGDARVAPSRGRGSKRH